MRELRVAKRRAASVSFVSAAEKVFGEKGYERAHMKDVAEEAGCATGTVYLYFKNKEDLFNALGTSHTNAIARTLLAAFKQGRDPLERLKK
ncbi:MAG: TetR/AcrR family transcriptional regulator [Planctomycetota bacterium]|nr:TetR/AcrR family transcriptional regulator [Planctomycetota bacterium]